MTLAEKPAHPQPTTMNDDTTTDATDATDPTADQATEDAAFESGYQGNTEKAPAKPAAEAPADESKETPPEAKEPPAAAPVTPPVDDDPFKGLSQPVRDRLAMVDNLAHSLRTAEGRIAALQRVQAAATKPSPAAPAPPTVREVLRGELPEVADALDELENRLRPAPAQASADEPAQGPEDAAVAREMQALTEVHSDWKEKSNSTDFSLWLATQGPQFADKVRSTASAAVLADALTRFKGYQQQHTVAVAQQAAAAAAAQASRTNRVAAAASLPTHGRSNSTADNSTIEDEEERAMAAGFRGT